MVYRLFSYATGHTVTIGEPVAAMFVSGVTGTLIGISPPSRLGLEGRVIIRRTGDSNGEEHSPASWNLAFIAPFLP